MFKGKLNELNAIILLMNNGFHCFKPIIDIVGSDLIVFKNNKYYKVQIKGCSTPHSTDRAVFSFSDNELKMEFDYALCMYKKDFWWIPFSKINSISIFCNPTPKNINVNKYAPHQNNFIIK
jgi:hypothetical protein